MKSALAKKLSYIGVGIGVALFGRDANLWWCRVVVELHPETLEKLFGGFTVKVSV